LKRRRRPLSEPAARSGGRDVDLEELMDAARSAKEGAYAPYSRFQVGAAVATDRGIFSGANVENASYGVTICAERVAAASAVAAGARRIDAVAMTSSAPGPISPCGACRQFLYEFGPEMIVVSEGTRGERKVWRLSELLVDGFGSSDMESAARE
jgi:cytidine deaminase